MNQKIRLTPIALALSGMLIAGSAMAGEPKGDRSRHHGPGGAEKQLAHMDEELDLSDEQSAELLVVLQAAEAERQALHDRLWEQLKPEICAHMETTHAEIEAVLTPQQAEQFEEMIAERKDRFAGHGRRGGMSNLDCDDL